MQFRRVMGISAACACLVSPAALAQKNPGLSTKPTGKIVGKTVTTASAAKETDLSREATARDAVAPTITPTSEELQYLQSAKDGDTEAQVRLGALYAGAENDPARWAEAVKLFEAATARNNAEALYNLASMFTNGRGVPQSDTQAFDYYLRAANLGSADAQYELASMYAQGRGTVQNEDAAINWARKAAEQGHQEAQFSVGRVLMESKDSDAQAEAIRRLEAAAAKGHTKSAIFLATVLARGDFGVRKDEAKSELLLKDLANRGDAECQMALASLYKIGEAFADRRELAEEWLRRAAAGGNQKAAEILRGEK